MSDQTQKFIMRLIYTTTLILLTIVLILNSTPSPHLASANSFFLKDFQNVWERTDKPVAEHKVSRSWLWGENVLKDETEDYLESLNGKRFVEYFDKARMEITHIEGDPNNQWYVSNGLLVVELMTGHLQVGDNAFVLYPPSNNAIAGDDLRINSSAPTYLTLAKKATLNGNENRALNKTGQPVDQYISYDGSINNGDAKNLLYAHYEVTLGHNIPDVFWTFLNQKDTIWDTSTQEYRSDTLFNWISVMGHPLTEAYWTTVKVGGADKLVLVQAFERRVLTYTPANNPNWRVEMGNVGLHYYTWRTSVTGGSSPLITPMGTATPSSSAWPTPTLPPTWPAPPNDTPWPDPTLVPTKIPGPPDLRPTRLSTMTVTHPIPSPTINGTTIPLPLVPIGAVCKDGKISRQVNATTCQNDGGILYWLYATATPSW